MSGIAEMSIARFVSESAVGGSDEILSREMEMSRFQFRLKSGCHVRRTLLFDCAISYVSVEGTNREFGIVEDGNANFAKKSTRNV